MIPKTIWILWLQGFEVAPEVVLRCRQSWIDQNPGWTVRSLDRKSLAEYLIADGIDPDRSDLSPQQISDIGRLSLLKSEGGVWVDASLFCAEPLDSWLGAQADHDFVAFHNAGGDRLFASYFMASSTEGAIVKRLAEVYLDLWRSSDFRRQTSRRGKAVVRIASRFLNRSPSLTTYWLAPIFTKTLGVYPYYLLHYAFNKVILEDRVLQEHWERDPYLDAWLPGMLLQTRPYQKGVESAVRLVRSGASPVYKLDWRLDPEDPYWRVVLHELKRCR